MRRSALLLLLCTVCASVLFAQPAKPPGIHNEAVGTHDLNSDAVGATPGDFRVDEGGAASYHRSYRLIIPPVAPLAP
jgi:hypothetical protein